MNSKKAGRAFLISIIIYIASIYAMAFFLSFLLEDFFLNNLICEGLLLIPAGIALLTAEKKPVEFLEFHKLKAGSVWMVILFTFLSVPTLTLMNLFSQLWVKNEVVAMMSEFDMGSAPFWKLFLSIGIVAPVCEELICRGIYYRSFKKTGGLIGGMLLSAILFAAMHMNFNQAAYALVMGILAVLLVEATGSLWSAILYHGFINGSQTFLMYGILKMNPDILQQETEMITRDILLYGIAAYFILAAVTLPLAWAVLMWLSQHEGRRDFLKVKHTKKDKTLTVSMILALILCIAMMTGILPMIINLLLALLI